MREIIIDGDKFSDLAGFYYEIDNVLTKGLTWATGHNLDAFSDLLAGGFGVHEYREQICLLWNNSEKSRVELGYIETVKYYEEVLLNCHPLNRSIIKDELKEAKINIGDTVFDMIVDIIKSSDNVELILR